MMNRIIVILGAGLLFGSSWAPAMEIPVGSIKIVKGSVVIIRPNQTLYAKIGENIFKNDSLKTGADGSLGIVFKDDTLLSLGPNSEVVIQEFMFSPGEGKLALVIRMIKGTAAYLTGIIAKLAPESVRFETPVGSAGVRGTKFVVKIEE